MNQEEIKQQAKRELAKEIWEKAISQSIDEVTEIRDNMKFVKGSPTISLGNLGSILAPYLDSRETKLT